MDHGNEYVFRCGRMDGNVLSVKNIMPRHTNIIPKRQSRQAIVIHFFLAFIKTNPPIDSYVAGWIRDVSSSEESTLVLNVFSTPLE